MTRRSYPRPKAKGTGCEEFPHIEVRAAAGRSYPPPEAKGGGWEEPPCTEARGGGQEEPAHIQGLVLHGAKNLKILRVIAYVWGFLLG